MKNLKYHHLGIPTTREHENEHYLEAFKFYHTNYDDNPYGIEWMRFLPDAPLPEPVKTVPHLAFKVDNLDEVLEGKDILIPPNSPSEGVRVAFIMHNGAPIEFLEYDESTLVKDFPEIRTQRLRLRQFHPGDAEPLFQLRTNPQIMEFMDTAPLENHRKAIELINTIGRNFNEQQMPIWALSLKEDKEEKLIGYAGYVHWQKAHFRAEVAYVVEPSYWRRGLVTEAMEEVLRYGFEKMDLHSIEGNVNPFNIASIKVLEKFAFRKEAHYKEAHHFDGKFVDTVIYSLLKPR